MTARFLQEDTYTGQFDDPLSLNLYTYCHNEPLMYVDPTGHNSQAMANLYMSRNNFTPPSYTSSTKSDWRQKSLPSEASEYLERQDRRKKHDEENKKAHYLPSEATNFLVEQAKKLSLIHI